MSDGSHMDKVLSIINRNIDEFLDVITQKTDITRMIRSDKSDFPIFHPANEHYFEFKRSESILERYIRDYLVTGILCSMLSDADLSPHTTVYMSDEESEVVHPSGYDNEAFGDDYPFAFILQTKNQRIGYRYSSAYLTKRELKRQLAFYRIDHIEIIDWSDTDSLESKKIPAGIVPEQRSKVIYITLRRFLVTYFSEEIYQKYITCVRQAVQSANDIIGFQTIPSLSLRYISDFKSDFLNRISHESLRTMRYHIFDENGELTNTTEELLQNDDYDVLDRRFFDGELYKALVGGEKYAKCFLTSEYLYSIFETGDTISFDYSAVATGYFKSVELLLDKIKEIWLKNPTIHHDLWIKGGTAKLANNPKKPWCRWNPDPNANGTQVEFKPINERRFSTEMGSLIWLLHDNPYGWNISTGKDIIHQCLLNYSQGCRNEHLHKDIITDTKVLKPIRENTLLCLYYLLGGCYMTGDISKDVAELLLEDDSYERLYKELIKISDHVSGYYIQFGEDEPIKAVWLFDQERPTYDENGKIISPIKFVQVDDFSEMHFETEKEYYELVATKKTLELSPQKIPKRIWWYTSIKGKNEITW